MPWWQQADIAFFAMLPEQMRESLTAIAWEGFKSRGHGFIHLTIAPETFTAWRAAWRVDGSFEGADISALYVPVSAFADWDCPEMLPNFPMARCQSDRYNPTTHMVLTSLAPGGETTDMFAEGWLALENLSGVDNAVVARCKDVDRAILNEISGARKYIRCAVNGEMKIDRDIPLIPFDLMEVKRIADDQRIRCLHQTVLAVTGPCVGEALVSGSFEGFIYLVRRRDEVKIGKTINLQQRLRQLESVFAIEGLDHYILTDDVSRAERAIHKWMAPFRMSGEWFRLPPDKADLIKHIMCLFMHELPDGVHASSEPTPASITTATRIAGLPFSDAALELMRALSPCAD